MKKRTFSILLIILVTAALKAQSFDKNPIALCCYNVMIDPKLGITPNKEIVDSIYCGVNAVLHESAGIQFRNVDFLKDKVTYFLGYPIGNAKNAAKSKMSPNYAKIVVAVSPDGIYSTNNGSFNIAGIGKERKKVNSKIKIEIAMTIYDENGEKIKELKAKSSSKEKIAIDSESILIGNFSIVDRKKNDSNFETFQELLYQTAVDLAKNNN